MPRIHPNRLGSRIALAVLIGGLAAPLAFGTSFPSGSAINLAIRKVPAEAGEVFDANGDDDNIQIVNLGRVVFTGEMNVQSTLDRIRANATLPSNLDGAVWPNPQGQLPKAPLGYYHQFVVWPSSNTSLRPLGIKFPGPARVVLGRNGDVHFTGNNFGSFYFVN